VVNLRANAVPDSGVALLLITCDPDLYARVHEVVCAWRWVLHLRTEPSPVPGSELPGLVILDADLADIDRPEFDWKAVLTALRSAGHDPCVLLASRVCDPWLHDEVVRRGGFDVIARSASCEQLMSALRFAWFWKKTTSPRLTSPNR
jgi:hypothetical protein